jgi:type II secretory ATPase GspE/PulE/Tfp pilus assembly ATPase PilB-like protein
MINKTLHNLFGFAAKEKAKKVVISGSESGLAFNCHLPDGEEAIFNIPKNLEVDLATNLRRLLEIAPGELASGKYCKLSDKNYHLNFRLSIVPDKFGEKIIINIIDEKKDAMTLNKLGLRQIIILMATASMFGMNNSS